MPADSKITITISQWSNPFQYFLTFQDSATKYTVTTAEPAVVTHALRAAAAGEFATFLAKERQTHKHISGCSDMQDAEIFLRNAIATFLQRGGKVERPPVRPQLTPANHISLDDLFTDDILQEPVQAQRLG